ncbi:hypothetical protein ACFL54_06505 [Planctomycetota bacterium]
MFLRFLTACLISIVLLALPTPGRPRCAEGADDHPRWRNSDATALIFKVDETITQRRKSGKPLTITNTGQFYTLRGKDVAVGKPETYMEKRRYKSLQSFVFLFCSTILDNPEDFKWEKNKGRGSYNFNGQYQAEGKWTYQPVKIDDRQLFEYSGNFLISVHPALVQGREASVSWTMLFDDDEEELRAIEYSIQAHVNEYMAVDFTERKLLDLGHSKLKLEGKGVLQRVPGTKPMPQVVVDQAIVKSTIYLTAQLGRYARLKFSEVEQDLYRKANPIGPGRLALVLTALAVKSDNRGQTEIMDMLYAFACNEKNFKGCETYTLALFLMAYKEIMDSARAEFEPPQQKQLDRLAAKLSRRLLSDFHDGKGWGYPLNPFNLSTTQYAMLGLYAAVASGVLEPDDSKLISVLKRTADVYFRHQQQNSKKVMLRNPAFGVQPYEVAPRGWSYNYAYASGPYGSMTVAGIGSVAIIYRLLSRAGKLPAALKEKLQAAINCALAWMQENYAVETSRSMKNTPSGFTGDEFFHYYYLYGMEKAGTLTAVKTISLYEWYRDCALHLISDQYPWGKFYNGKEWSGPDVATAFGLLVLKNASAQITADISLPSDGSVTSGD